MVRRIVASIPVRRLPALGVAWGIAAFALARDSEHLPSAIWTSSLSFALALVAARRSHAVTRAALWGLAVVIATLGVPSDLPWCGACSAAGAGTAVVAACIAVARMAPDCGVARPEFRSPWLVGAMVSAAWTAAAANVLWQSRVAPPWATAAGPVACFVSAALLVATVERERARRRLELGVRERVRAMRFVISALATATAIADVLSRVKAETALRTGITVTSVCVAAAASHPDAVLVAQRARRMVALMVTGLAVALLGAAASEGGDRWLVMVLSVGAALGVGAYAGLLESPFQPAEGVWLAAFHTAGLEALRADPEDAIREALLALRVPVGLSSPSPELWTFEPSRRTSVDAAGYLHELQAHLPPLLTDVASREPETALRLELLHALGVRRPDLRPLGRWMADRGAAVVVVVAGSGEAEGSLEGVLVLSAGERTEPFTLEELRAAKHAADRLSGACRGRAVQVRLLARAHDAALRADVAQERLLALEHLGRRDAERHVLATARVARAADVGHYAPASRWALGALERRVQLGAPVVVVAPSPVDALPLLARAHLAGPRRAGPFVVVEGASAEEHDEARWRDPTGSPLALCRGGLLVLLDGAALPLAIQQIVARAWAERRLPWESAEPFDAQLALTSIVSPGELLASGRLDRALAARLGDGCERPIALAALADRAEDLRALVVDRLGREGMRQLGRPVGIEPAAFARLAHHDFPGDCRELDCIVERLVAACAAAGRDPPDIVRVADVDALRVFEIASQAPRSDENTLSLRSGRKKDPLSA